MSVYAWAAHLRLVKLSSRIVESLLAGKHGNLVALVRNQSGKLQPDVILSETTTGRAGDRVGRNSRVVLSEDKILQHAC